MSTASSGAIRARISAIWPSGPILEELKLVVVVELLEDIRLELAVVVTDGLDDLFALVAGGRLDEVGNLRRMELCQLRVGDAKAHRRHVPDERLDLRPSPRNSPVAMVLRRVPSAAACASRRVGRCRRLRRARSPPPAASSISLARTSLAPSHVDQLPIEQVALEQHLLRPALEMPEVELGLAHHNAAARDLETRSTPRTRSDRQRWRVGR